MSKWQSMGHLDHAEVEVCACVYENASPLRKPPWLSTPASPTLANMVHQRSETEYVGYCYQGAIDGVWHGPYTAEQMDEWYASGAFPLETPMITCVHGEFQPVGDVAPWEKQCPEGWCKEPSRSRPGEFTYVNSHTTERQAHIPISPASRLPAGWKLVPSKTRAGAFSFLNTNTNEKQRHVPQSPAPQSPATISDLADDLANMRVSNTHGSSPQQRHRGSPPPPSATPETGGLWEGQHVVLQGLKSAVELNSRVGVLAGPMEASSGRFEVVLEPCGLEAGQACLVA